MAGNLGCCKYLMFFFNLLIFISGAVLLGTGIWAATGADSFKELTSISNSAVFNAVYILIAVGAFLFLVGFLGCCGAIKENRCMLGTFFALILVIFIVEIVGGVLAFVYYPQAKTAAIGTLDDYGNTDEIGITVTSAWDAFQTAFQCCGINGYSDWLTQIPRLLAAGKVPPAPCEATNLSNGCEAKIQHYFWVLGGIACAVLAVELLAMIFACCLYQNVGKERYA